jgi:outer membrane immunogenic protein
MKRNMSLSVVGVSCVLLASLVGSASAADMPLKAPPPPVWSWTGCYVGGNIGFSWEGTTGYSTTPTTTFAGTPTAVTGLAYPATSAQGAIGGVQVGCNYQVQQWVLGIEGDWDPMGHQGTAATTNILQQNPADTSVTKELWTATLRGRLGIVADRNLLYVTGGAAWMKVESVQFVATGATTTLNSQTDTRLGWTIGGGIERAYTNNILFRLEYLYVKIPSYTTFTSGPFLGGPVVPLTTSLAENIVRAGVSYKF